MLIAVPALFSPPTPATLRRPELNLKRAGQAVEASYLASKRSPAFLIVVVFGHAALLWTLGHLAPVKAVLRQWAPVPAHIISPAVPAQADAPAHAPVHAFSPQPTQRAAAPTTPALPVPVVEPLPQVNEAPPRPAAAEPAVVAAAAVQTSAAPAAAPLSPPLSAPTPPPAAAPPAPKLLPASAVSYRLPPAIEVPLASRRLNESGTVVLRVWVGTDGVPRQISVQRSSGFARLDEQALAAMRQARFTPYSENGQALECIVIAPLAYELS